MKNIIFYHADCLDGAMSMAQVAHIFEDNILYPLSHGAIAKSVDDLIHETFLRLKTECQNSFIGFEPEIRVFFLDYFPSADMINDTNWSMVKELYIVDHHAIHDRTELVERVMSERYPDLNYDITFNPKYCGAINTHHMLNHLFFNAMPKHFTDLLMPLLLRVNDRDLWINGYHDTEAIVKYLSTMLGNYAGELREWFGNTIRSGKGGELLCDTLYHEGEVILKYHQQMVAELYKNTLYNAMISPDHLGVDLNDYLTYIADDGNNYLVATTNLSKPFVSDVSQIILDNKPPVALVLNARVDEDGNPVFDFRSRGDINVAHLAKKFGGGGHPGAAGCHTTWDDAENIFKVFHLK